MRFGLIFILLSVFGQNLNAQIAVDPIRRKLRPVKLAPLPTDLAEISGMEFYNGYLYALNDGGHPSRIYKLDTSTGTIVQTIVLPDTPNVDWEALSQDEHYFYIGDVGGNNAIRKEYAIHKFSKNLLNLGTDTLFIHSGSIEKITFTYPDQTADSKGLEFDCEAMLIHNNKMHLFSKNWMNQYAYHYTLPLIPGNYVAEKKDSLDTKGYLLTGVTWKDNVLLFTSYTIKGRAALIVAQVQETDLKIRQAWRIKLPWVLCSGQIEGISNNNGNTYISNEEFGFWIFKVRQKLRRLRDEKWERLRAIHSTLQTDIPSSSTPSPTSATSGKTYRSFADLRQNAPA